MCLVFKVFNSCIELLAVLHWRLLQIIVVVDSCYGKFARGQLEDTDRAVGSGVLVEFNAIIDRLYSKARNSAWLIPVLFQDGIPSDIPRTMSSLSYVNINTRNWGGIEELRARLLDVPLVALPEPSQNLAPFQTMVISSDPVD